MFLAANPYVLTDDVIHIAKEGGHTLEMQNPYSREHGKRPKKRTGRWGKWLVALIIIGGLVYLFAATAAGKWLSENVFQPGMEALSCAGSPNVTDEAPGTTSVAAGATQTVQQNACTWYCIQTGAFSNEANAGTQAEAMKLKGGAGYIYHDGMFRVLIAAYASPEDAKKVRDQIKTEQSIDVMIYPMKADALDLKITANEKQISSFRAALKAYSDAQNAALSAVKDADAGDSLSAETQTLLKEASTGLDTAKTTLASEWEGNRDNTVYTAVTALLDLAQTETGSLALTDSISGAQGKAEVKHAFLCIAGGYVTFVKTAGAI
jgi:hypothetical protein